MRDLGGRDEAAGVSFERGDLPRAPRVEASLGFALSAPRRTRLRRGGIAIETVEHLLAACAGLDRWRAHFILFGPEVPILDGSARAFCQLLTSVPGSPVAATESRWRVMRPFELRRGHASCRLIPAREGYVSCHVDFAHPAIGHQEVSWRVGDRRAFVEEIAPARTFGFVEEVVMLRRAGLIRGASLDAAVVFDRAGPLKPLRFPDEPVRHKLLDLIGDLALLGAPLVGRLITSRPSHALTIETLRAAVAAGALRREGAGTR